METGRHVSTRRIYGVWVHAKARGTTLRKRREREREREIEREREREEKERGRRRTRALSFSLYLLEKEPKQRRRRGDGGGGGGGDGAKREPQRDTEGCFHHIEDTTPFSSHRRYSSPRPNLACPPLLFGGCPLFLSQIRSYRLPMPGRSSVCQFKVAAFITGGYTGCGVGLHRTRRRLPSPYFPRRSAPERKRSV